MKKTTVFTHAACLRHDTGPGHAERIARLEAVLSALREPEFENLAWETEPPEATVEQLARAHDESYIHRMLGAAPEEGYFFADADTVLCPHSVEAALRAAGAVIMAVDHVLRGKTKTAFCAVRPPGHHAERNRAMGFCIFSNVAIGALHAITAHGLKKVAIVDFDVHHGNGTADIADGHPEILFLSTHQYPLYPGSGGGSEKGRLGNIVNIPLAAGSGGAEFRKVFSEKILPALEKFRPELIMISAGFDAHRDDPLAQMALTEEDYGWMTAELKAVARKHAQGRIVSALEGGYDLKALAASVTAHVRALCAPD